MIHIPKKLSYIVPESNYRSELYDVLIYDKQNGRDLERIIRIVYEITSLKHPRYRYMAGRSYKPGKLEALSHDLESWLGPEFETMLDENGGLSEEKLKSLIGRPADIQVIHIDNDDYDHPFCHVQGVFPPGTLVGDEPEQKAA